VKVYNLHFIREYDDREDTELSIGTYASKADALAAVEQLKGKTGFRDFPEGFEIDEIALGLTGWRDGFVSVVGPPPKNACGEVFDLPANTEERE